MCVATEEPVPSVLTSFNRACLPARASTPGVAQGIRIQMRRSRSHRKHRCRIAGTVIAQQQQLDLDAFDAPGNEGRHALRGNANEFSRNENRVPVDLDAISTTLRPVGSPVSPTSTVRSPSRSRQSVAPHVVRVCVRRKHLSGQLYVARTSPSQLSPRGEYARIMVK